MKKEELSLGLWVYNGECRSNMGGDYDVVFYPKQLTLEDFKFWADNDWSDTDFEEFLKPIPLDNKFFIKNGFVTETDGAYWKLPVCEKKWLEYYGHEHRLRLWYKDIDEWQNHRLASEVSNKGHCFYVHELQRLLVDWKIEKKIVL